MPLAEIQDAPETDADQQSWSFANMVLHRDINRLVLAQKNIRIDEFALDPFNPSDPVGMQQWLNLHQQMHNQQNQALGIAGYNLSEVNWEDDKAKAQWIFAHADEHNRIATILGVS